MVEGNVTRLWMMRITFVLLALLTMFTQLLPLSTDPVRLPGPDVLLALCLAWSLRRPDYVPPLAIGMVILLGDLFFQRPPGLMAAIVVLACDAIRKRGAAVRDAGFITELVTAALAILGVILAYRVALTIFMLPRPPLGMSLVQAMLTFAIYPVVVLASDVLLGVRARTKAEVAAGRNM